MRKRARVDTNHREIRAALRQAGCTVLDLAAVGHGCPDLMVAINGHNLLIEVKSPEARKRRFGGLTPEQVEFFQTWRGHKARVYSLDEALEVVRQFRR